MNLSLSSVVMKLNTIDEWDLASRYSRFPSQHSGLACWSVSYLMTYSISSSCTSLLLQMFPSKSFIFSMLTLAWKYSMSGSAETRVFSVKIFLILFRWWLGSHSLTSLLPWHGSMLVLPSCQGGCWFPCKPGWHSYVQFLGWAGWIVVWGSGGLPWA